VLEPCGARNLGGESGLRKGREREREKEKGKERGREGWERETLLRCCCCAAAGSVVGQFYKTPHRHTHLRNASLEAIYNL
jgi:hypothetical protein